MALFKPAWKSENRQKALDAVYKTDDQTTLKTIVFNAPLSDIQEAAAERITDQAILIEIIREKSGEPVEEVAFLNISETDALTEIAREMLGNVWKDALEKLTDKDIRFNIAVDTHYLDVLEEIISHADDVEFMKQLFLSDIRNKKELYTVHREDREDKVSERIHDASDLKLRILLKIFELSPDFSNEKVKCADCSEMILIADIMRNKDGEGYRCKGTRSDGVECNKVYVVDQLHTKYYDRTKDSWFCLLCKISAPEAGRIFTYECEFFHSKLYE